MTFPVETILRKLLRHPHRRWIVIIGTLLVGIVFILPAVDTYNAACQRFESLQEDLQRARDAAGQLETLQVEVEKWKQEALRRQRLAATEERVAQLRSDLVSLARKCGCQLRRIRVEEPKEREWVKGDDPLAVRPASEKAEKTPFVLRSRRLSVSVTGNLASIGQFLATVSAQELLVHTVSVTLQKSQEDAEQVMLELELVLLELAQRRPPQSA
jgi:Tfp pilus assembly protein PilO